MEVENFGTEKVHKQDHYGNPIGCWSHNPILDTRLYDIGFLDGEVSLQTANAIAQAMYAQCNMDGNKYLLLDCFVDVQKDPTAISQEEQNAINNGREYLWHLP